MNWISVKDRLPELRKMTLGYNATYDAVDVFYYDSSNRFWDLINDEDNTKQITHWMPLPEPPNK